jgi:hypothetical protein
MQAIPDRVMQARFRRTSEPGKPLFAADFGGGRLAAIRLSSADAKTEGHVRLR